MQNHDLHRRLPGTGAEPGFLGAEHRTQAEQQFEKRFGSINTGYRWLKVNEFLYIYIAVWVLDPAVVIGAGPESEVLAYVQLLPSGKFRALRAAAAGNIVMQIPYGPAEEVKAAVDVRIQLEKYLLS